jgi:hypothetical protein
MWHPLCFTNYANHIKIWAQRRIVASYRFKYHGWHPKYFDLLSNFSPDKIGSGIGQNAKAFQLNHVGGPISGHSVDILPCKIRKLANGRDRSR